MKIIFGFLFACLVFIGSIYFSPVIASALHFKLGFWSWIVSIGLSITTFVMIGGK